MKKLILIALVAVSLVSCKKFLEEYSQSELKPTTASHYGEILYSDGYPGSVNPIHSWAIYLDDDVECYSGPTLIDPTVVAAPSGVYQWQPDFLQRLKNQNYFENSNTWATYYKALMGVNVVLQFIDGGSGKQADKDQFKGEAYTLRAFYHFMLVNLYARPYNDSTTTPDKSAGIPIRTNSDLAEVFLPRNSVKEVYAQIVSDLDSAVLLLEKEKTIKTKQRISFVAAHLLASRVHLYMENWDAAIAHADKVIQYHPQLMDLNNWNGVPEPETKPLLGLANVETIWCYGTEKEKLTTPYGIAYDISHNLVSTFESNDLRSLTGFYVNPPFFKEYFAPEFSAQKMWTDHGSGLYIQPISWRSAEAYLNRAEACVQLYLTKGDAQAAQQALVSLNALRAARFDRFSFSPWTIQAPDVLLQMCREERRRELYTEEVHRWFDLRRYGMPSITHIYRPNQTEQQVYVLPARDPQYVLPIPDEVISRNPALRQNPLLPGIRQAQ